MSLMNINTTSSTSTEGLEMNTALSNRIPEPESFSDSLCQLHCNHKTISVDEKASDLSLSDKFETGKHQSIHPSFSTCNFVFTSGITDIPERNLMHKNYGQRFSTWSTSFRNLFGFFPSTRILKTYINSQTKIF